MFNFFTLRSGGSGKLGKRMRDEEIENLVEESNLDRRKKSKKYRLSIQTTEDSCGVYFGEQIPLKDIVIKPWYSRYFQNEKSYIISPVISGKGKYINTSESRGFVIDSNNKLWTSGHNNNGSLGREGEPEFIIIDYLNGIKFIMVCGTKSYTIALTNTGELYACGSIQIKDGEYISGSVNSKLICITENFLLKNTEIFVKIAAGLNHCVALTSFGRVFVWGDGRRNQIGRKLMEHRLDNGLKPEPLRIRKAKDIYCGYYNTFIITFDDKVFACGYNSHLQTGIIQQKRKLEDNIVQLLTEVQLPPGKIIQIAAHYTHTLILYQDGSVYILGGISQSKWNDNTDMIKKPCWNTEDYKPLLLNLNDIIKVSANNRYNLALNSRGEIFYWSGRGGTVKQLNITSQKGRIIDLEQNQDYIIFLIK